MASNLQKTDHLYVPFDRYGNALHDGKGTAKVFKSMKTLDLFCYPDNGCDKPGSGAYTDVVEFVPVVHGQWNARPYYKADGNGGVFKHCDFHYCSECATERPMVPPYNYCPNCGAKMDGERSPNDTASG